MIDRKDIEWLIDQYQDEVNKLEEDRMREGVSVSNAYKTGKIGAYGRVIADLKGLLDESEENAEPYDTLKLDGMLEDAYEHGYQQARHDYEAQPCDNCVDREAVAEKINNIGAKGFVDYNSYSEMFDFVDTLPPVTPKQRMGKWIYEKRKRLVNETDEGAVYVTDYWCKCSKCGGDFGYRKMKDAFCKYCGAKMVEPQQSEDIEKEQGEDIVNICNNICDLVDEIIETDKESENKE